MSGSRIVVDGLWRCLCPSIDPRTFPRVFGAPGTFRRPSGTKTDTRRHVRVGKIRAQHTSASDRLDPEAFSASFLAGNPPEAVEAARSPSRLGEHDGVLLGEGPPGSESRQTRPSSTGIETERLVDESVTVPRLLAARGYRRDLQSAPAPVIYRALWELRRRVGQSSKIKEFVKHLVEDRGEQRGPAIYEAMVVANWDTAGSAADLWQISKEMQEAKMWKNSSFYHSVLQALVIHPNYLLRNIMLREMKSRWIELTPEGRAHAALGLLRDQQYELAYDKLKEMIRERVPFPPWVYDIFICTFTQMGFVDEAFSILQSQRQLADDKYAVSLNVLYFLLDECSRAMHYEGTQYVWREMAETGILNPPDGITLHALNTFARHGDVELATQAIQHLSSRGVKLGMHHYEALIDCYSAAEDVENAIRVLCIMSSAGVKSDDSATRSIFTLLKHAPNRTDAAVDALFALRGEHDIPISAFNVVVEALCQKGDTEKATGLYQQVRQLCRSGPDETTFKHLLSGHPRSEVAGFLVAEMEVFGVKLTLGMYNDLVCSYALDTDGSLDDAFRTVREVEDESLRIGDTGAWLSKYSVLVLAERCFKDEDPRIWHVVDGARLRGMDVEDDVQKLSAKWDPAMGEPSSATGASSQPTAG